MTTKQIQNLLAFLGFYNGSIDGVFGQLSQESTRKFQEAFGGLVIDGKAGVETQNALRQAVASGIPSQKADGSFWDEIEFFTPEEFKCKCGGRYCSGYPHTIQPLLVQICDRARKWSNHPIAVVSGLRCETHNKNENGVKNSQHLYGEAADLCFYGVTPAAALAWLQSQKDVRYAYQIQGCSNIHFDIQPVGR